MRTDTTFEPSWWRVIAASSARGALTVVGLLVACSILPTVLGWSSSVVLTGSMEPALAAGDVLVTRPVDADQLRTGQVLLVDDPDRPGELRSHRLQRVRPDGQLVLRGDANPTPDSTLVARSAVHGAGALDVPAVGLPVVWWNEHRFAPLALAAVALVLASRACRLDTSPRRGSPRRLLRRRRASAGTAVAGLVVVAMMVPPMPDTASAAFTRLTANGANQFTAAGTFHAYQNAVLADAPTHYWRLGEASGTAAVDTSGNGRAATYYNSPILGEPSALTSAPGNKSMRSASTGFLTANAAGTAPASFSIEVWIKTTTTGGGRILGFGNGGTNQFSSTSDRQLYMNPSGKVVFGVGNATKTVATSPLSYNNGAWHHVLGTFTGSALTLYVDGVQVATAVGVTTSYTGYWRAGAENLSSWPTPPNGSYFVGGLDELAVYGTALSAARVSAHYTAATTG